MRVKLRRRRPQANAGGPQSRGDPESEWMLRCWLFGFHDWGFDENTENVSFSYYCCWSSCKYYLDIGPEPMFVFCTSWIMTQACDSPCYWGLWNIFFVFRKYFYFIFLQKMFPHSGGHDKIIPRGGRSLGILIPLGPLSPPPAWFRSCWLHSWLWLWGFPLIRSYDHDVHEFRRAPVVARPMSPLCIEFGRC